MNLAEDKPLWTPSLARIASSNLTAFRVAAEQQQDDDDDRDKELVTSAPYGRRRWTFVDRDYPSCRQYV